MAVVNIQIDSKKIRKLKELTGESTAQKAVDSALEYIFREAEQRRFIDLRRNISFYSDSNPIKSRKNGR